MMGGPLHYLSHSSIKCCRPVVAKWQHSFTDMQDKYWLLRQLHFHLATAKKAWTDLLEHIRNQGVGTGCATRCKEQCLFPGDEQDHFVNVLKCGPQQGGETAFSSGLQACLGLVCSPQEPQQRLRAALYPSSKGCLRRSGQRKISCSVSLNSPLEQMFLFVYWFKEGKKDRKKFLYF